jgi:magnesium chelatase subunit D
MTENAPLTAWDAAKLAGALLRTKPRAFGGIHIRGGHGPALDAWLSCFDTSTLVVIPHHIDVERLIGGIDLAATLAAGKPVHRAGLLREREGALFLLTGGERASMQVAAVLAQSLDAGTISLIALDESLDDENGLAAVLSERLAFQIDLRGVQLQDLTALAVDEVVDSDMAPLAEPLLSACIGFGVRSLRAGLFVNSCAAMLAAGARRTELNAQDMERAASLIIAHRARQMPAPPEEPEGADQEPQTPDAEPEALETQDLSQADMVTEAVRAALPAALLAQLHAGALMNQRLKAGTTQIISRKRSTRGRPLGVKQGDPRRGERLNMVATLTAAAPWQRLRKHDDTDARVLIAKQDFRITRFKPRTETVIIFVVDASGSAAFQRLSEAKGAVELVLADCYIHRDKVALLAFRGTAAQLLLPPTRSLERAKRALSALPGGGGTPLALGIDAAAAQALLVQRTGAQPVVIFLTDGKANVARDGTGGRARAQDEAMQAAKALRALSLRSVVLDISPKPTEMADALARQMGATYLPLPRADAASIATLARTA